MIYFDDVFYQEFLNTNKPVTIVDRDGNEINVTLKEDQLERSYYVDDLKICTSNEVCWSRTELARSVYGSHYVHARHVTFAKAQALREDIRNSLLDTIVPFARYFEYYRGSEGVFTIYAIDSYDLRQENRSSIIGKFVERDDRLDDFPEHKLQGIVPSTDNNERVVSATVEAWRYRALEWNVIREICPEFVEQVLNGQLP